MRILAIETSCDETAASVVVAQSDDTVTLESTIVSSQVALHAAWGGVVPNLAAREHTKHLIPVITAALADAYATRDTIDAIAVTHCPGLIPALLTGVAAAKTLAYAWKKPLIGIHHIEGHIYANWIDNGADIIFPVLALVVSGGHTQLILMRDHCTYDIIGQTHDDAVGEAFDKVARMLGIGYPGGPAVAAHADAFAATGAENPYTFPRPMMDKAHYDFSFSGLKTAVLYAVKEFRAAHALADDAPLPHDTTDAIAAAFQDAAVPTSTIRSATAPVTVCETVTGAIDAACRLR